MIGRTRRTVWIVLALAIALAGICVDAVAQPAQPGTSQTAPQLTSNQNAGQIVLPDDSIMRASSENLILQLLRIVKGYIAQNAVALGFLLGLVGFGIQVMVRREWPTGRLNESAADKVLDWNAFVTAVVGAVLVAILAAYFLRPADLPYVSTWGLVKYFVEVMVFGYVGGDLAPLMQTITELPGKIMNFIRQYTFPRREA